MQPKNGFDWFLAAFKKYAEFEGRSRRKEFWYFQLFATLANIMSKVFDADLGTRPLFNLLFNAVILLPQIGVCVRRLHDTNRSGWWTLFPIVNIVFWTQDSDPSENRFGPCPKSAAEMHGAAPGKSSISMASLDQIERLAALRDKGVLTDEEFQQKKLALL